MSAGERIEQAQKLCSRASGMLVIMVTKRQVARYELEQALRMIESSADIIREVLTVSSSRSNLRVPTDEGEGHGSTD